MKILSVLLFSAVAITSQAQQNRTQHLLIVTLDGFRWQEVFNGADSLLLFNTAFTPDSASRSAFWKREPAERRSLLMPFLWNVIAKQGQLYGNRAYGNEVNCANPYWFSYPGYSELFTGSVDRSMRSNRKVVNPNTNVLEFIHAQPGFEGRVGAFSTWDVIPYVLRTSVNGIQVNADPADKPAQKRCDETTFDAAYEYLTTAQPRVVFLSLDGTDEHGHGGRYGEYLSYALKADQMISKLWTWLQSQEMYKDKTTLLITTDHGRGRRSGSWKTHGRWAAGSNQIWMAAIGPDTPPLGEMKNEARYYQKQVARTVASFLNLDYQPDDTTAPFIDALFYPSYVISTRD